MFEHLTGRTPKPIIPETSREYAVVAPFLPDTNELLFEVRSSKLNRQPGEICFPGGRVEAGESPLSAGIRETVEELLIQESQLEIIAPLDILTAPDYTLVHPYLAYLRDYRGTFNHTEVQEVFTVPFDYFLETQPVTCYNRITIEPEEPERVYGMLGVEDYPWMDTRYPVYYYQYGNKLIWGMTAMFTMNLVKLYRAAHTG